MSPDETATAVSARLFGSTGSMRIDDPLLATFPLLHPRSFVTQGSAMVPVGFLGLPMLTGILWKLVGEWGIVFFTPLLVLSVLYPLWRFTKKFGAPAQLAAVTTWLTFPTVILYSNRGLFPNLPVVCFSVWAAYLLWERRTHARAVLAGVCAGIALAIRPVEAIWMLAWFAAAWRFRAGRRQNQERTALLLVSAGCLLILIAALVVAWRTYGSPFAVGYLLRDPVSIQPSVDSTASLLNSWPFGFHPRVVWFNLKTYLVGFLGPWIAVSLLALCVFLKRREARPMIFVFAWTLLTGLLMYGQALYQDHVGVNVSSVGNSFLRYLLPLAPLCAIATAALVSWLFTRLSASHARMSTLMFVGSLILLGQWTALQRDDEGIFTSSQELLRYQTIRMTAVETVGQNAIVLSERSDKIFFPVFLVGSPLPSRAEIRSLVTVADVPVLLYSSTLDSTRLLKWNNDGIRLRPIFSSLNETLYQMVADEPAPTP